MLLLSGGLVIASGACCLMLLSGDFSAVAPTEIVREAPPPAPAAVIASVDARTVDPTPIPAPGQASPPSTAAANGRSNAAASAGARPSSRGALQPMATGETPAAIIARAWSTLGTNGDAPVRGVDDAPARAYAAAPARTVAAAPARKAVDTAAHAAGDSPVRYAALGDATVQYPGRARILPPKDAKTTLVELDSAPFPYDGKVSSSGARFLNVEDHGRRGHRSFRGRVFWADETYNDRRVLLHIPAGFDPARPAVMIVFLHGNGATLTRDVLERQKVAAQVSASGANAVLVAPQLAVDAADSSAGKFWEPGAFKRFVGDAAMQLTKLYGDPHAEYAFANMPIMIVAYSGGFLPAAYALHVGGVKSRVRGVMLLDAVYGELDKFVDFMAGNKSAFFVSVYTHGTKRRTAELMGMLKERGVAVSSSLDDKPKPGSATFLATDDANHRNFVTYAYTQMPVKDMIARLSEYRR